MKNFYICLFEKGTGYFIRHIASCKNIDDAQSVVDALNNSWVNSNIEARALKPVTE